MLVIEDYISKNIRSQKMKIFKVFTLAIALSLSFISCSEDGGGEMPPSGTSLATVLGQQEWRIVSFSGTEEIIFRIGQPDADTAIQLWDYLSDPGFCPQGNCCNLDNTFAFNSGGGTFQMNTNTSVCANQNEPTSGIIQSGTFSITSNESIVNMMVTDPNEDILTRTFFLDAEDTFQSFNFNPASEPYDFELIAGDANSNRLALRFINVWMGTDRVFFSDSSQEVEINLVIEKVN